MCLYPSELKASEADAPMTVYKIMQLKKNGLASYYQDFGYTLGQTYYELDFIKEIELGDIVRYGFHAYTTLERAIKVYASLVCVDDMQHHPFVLVQCEVPKGAMYYRGTSDSWHIGDPLSEQEICASEIKILGWRHYDEKEWRTEYTYDVRIFKQYKIFYGKAWDPHGWEMIIAESPVKALEIFDNSNKGKEKIATQIWYCSYDRYYMVQDLEKTSAGGRRKRFSIFAK